MKVRSIQYSKTYEMPTIGWEKIGVQIDVDETDKTEEVLDEAKKIVHTWHVNNNPDFYGKHSAISSGKFPIVGEDLYREIEEDKEWEEIKKKLSSIEFQEDAQHYINTTPYKLMIQARQIINEKPLKNK